MTARAEGVIGDRNFQFPCGHCTRAFLFVTMAVIIEGVEYVKKTELAPAENGATPVLIRSYRSGVHFGLLVSRRDAPQGLEVVLAKSRRVHYWVGAASLSEMAVSGIGNHKESRVTVEVETITIQNVIEEIPLTETAYENLKSCPVWKIN